ncbi:MAG: hypothetical protein EZS28_022502 [Streblomastix strix]|uniref:Uncharacterized protein n=1 Tax=Streblomastix strix TaxID=222440 RepID=A0A5J4VHH9_9EUKA|nr:MAG: hypothetical protein EZS28_022502 [Streblomastix strix]
MRRKDETFGEVQGVDIGADCEEDEDEEEEATFVLSFLSDLLYNLISGKFGVEFGLGYYEVFNGEVYYSEYAFAFRDSVIFKFYYSL